MAFMIHFTIRTKVYAHLEQVREKGRAREFTLAVAMLIVLILGICAGLHYNFTKPQLWFENIARCKCGTFPRVDGLLVTNGVVFEG